MSQTLSRVPDDSWPIHPIIPFVTCTFFIGKVDVSLSLIFDIKL